MKSIQLLIVFSFFSFSNIATSQIYRFKTSSMSIMEKNTKGKWGEWTEFKKAELIISLDGKKDRIIVNSVEMQLFTILSYGEKVVTEYDETVPFECEDNTGAKCTILIVTRKNQNNRMQFYINYPDLRMVYNMYSSN